MTEYLPFFVIGAFAVLLYAGTIVWTEYLFPEQKPKQVVKQRELEFPEHNQHFVHDHD
jgi:hypothetical protein